MESATPSKSEIEELSTLLTEIRKRIVWRAIAFVLSLFGMFAIGMLLFACVPPLPFWFPVILIAMGMTACIVVYANSGMTVVYRRARALDYRVVMNQWGRCFALKVIDAKQDKDRVPSRFRLLMSELLGLYDQRSTELIPLEDPSYEESHDSPDDESEDSDE